MNPAFDRTLLSRIEDAGINASAPPQQRWVDGWLVRFSPGKAKRARCIQAVAPGLMPVDAKLAICERVYRDVGLPMFVRITPFSQPSGLDEALAQRGMQRIDDTRVMVRPSLVDLPSAVLPAGYRLERVGHAGFAQAVGALRGSPLEQREAQAERLEHSPVPFDAVVMRNEHGEITACGQFAIEAELVGLYDVFTAESERGRGLARQLCLSLLEGARAAGATTAYLQVEGDNLPARRIYHRIGFADAYAYHYRGPSAA